MGVIRRFTIDIDRSRLLENTQAILLARISPKFLTQTMEKLKEMPEIREIHMVSGEYNLFMKIEVKGLSQVSSFIADKLSSVEGISDVECLVVTNTVKEDTSPLLEEEMTINVRCDFCKALIVEKPIIEYIEGGKYYFSSKECLEAFKERLGRREV